MKKVQEKIKTIFRPLRKQKQRPTTKADPNALSAGALLPPELFPRLLHWVNLNNTSGDVYERINRVREDSGPELSRLYRELEKANPTYTLRSCALVCSYWANHCRRYMFYGSILRIKSLQMAEDFRRYSTLGSRRLLRVSRLVRAIHVDMIVSKTPRSFVELAFIPETANRLGNLRIIGPFPPDLPPAKLSSPHWHLPSPIMPPPTATAYRSIILSDIRFPSFTHITQFLKFFRATKKFELFGIDWGGKTPDELVHWTKPAKQFRETIEISASQCTDTLLLCKQLAMLYPDCPLRGIASQDHNFAMNLMNFFDDFYRELPMAKSGDEGIKCNIRAFMPVKQKWQSFRCFFYDNPRNTVSTALQFIVDTQPRSPSSSPGRSSSPILPRIVGLAVTISSRASITNYSTLLTADLTLLRATIRNHPSLHVVAIVFTNYAMLEGLTTQVPALRETSPNAYYVFACRRSTEHPFTDVLRRDDDRYRYVPNWVAIDPSSLQPTGEQWEHDEYIIGDLVESRPRSR